MAKIIKRLPSGALLTEAEQEPHAILDKLDSGEVSIANITSSDVALLLHTAKRELSDIKGMKISRFDRGKDRPKGPV